MFALVDARTTPVTSVDDLPWAAVPPGMTTLDEARLADGVIAWQGSLFGSDEPELDPSLPGLQRHWLADGCYLDHLPGWLTGSDTLFAELVARLSWQRRRVPMYGRMVDEPRLTDLQPHTRMAEGAADPITGEAVGAHHDRFRRRRYGRDGDSPDGSFSSHGCMSLVRGRLGAGRSRA